MHYARKNLFIAYAVFIGVTVFLWTLAKPSIAIIFRFPVSSAMQLFGLTAASLIGLNLLLAARLKFFENLFGGFDKVYKQHRLTGEIAFAFMLAHPTLLLISQSNLWHAVETYVLDLSYAPYNYGKLAVTCFSIIIILTLFVRLPFHIWKRIHQLMIVPLIFLSLHVFTIPSDVAVFMPLRVWILGLLMVGIIMYIYKVILYKFIGPKLSYTISEVILRRDITELMLVPSGTALHFEPGQFVFAVFDPVKRGEKTEVSHEEHPFSISSSPTEATIRLSVKKSGDFTATLPKLKKGDKVTLYGPYGQFGRYALSTNKELLMIAGGIGVTPFLSIIRYARAKNINLNFTFFYVYGNESESVYKEELAEAISKISQGELIPYASEKSGRITAKQIADRVRDIQNKTILLCGPKGMMIALTAQFVELGVKRRNIIFEDFDLKG